MMFRLETLLAPIRHVAGGAVDGAADVPGVLVFVHAGTLYSFSVTYLTQRGMSLTDAGSRYACLQSAGVFAANLPRLVRGSDGRPAANLTAAGACGGAGCVAVYGVHAARSARWWVVAVVTTACRGFGASWNGIYMAEVARLAPPENVADATSASTLFTFMGYVLAPSLFAFAVQLYWCWRWPDADGGGATAPVMAVVQTVLLVRGAKNGVG
jgi:hypothetical protein